MGWYDRRKSIVDIEKIYLNIGVKEAIQKLRALQGSTRNYFSNKAQKYFYCIKNGRFGFDYGRRNIPIHFVDGKVAEENGKTVVIIYTHNNKLARRDRKFDIVCNSILMGIVIAGIIFMMVNGYDFSPMDILKILFFIFIYILSFIVTHTTIKIEDENSEEDIAFMKEEIYNRIEAIEKWEADLQIP